MKNEEENIISFEEYDNSLDSVDYIELIKMMRDRLNIPNVEIDKIIENHFNFKYSIKKNYKNFVESIDKYMVTRKSFRQPTLF